MYQAVSLWLLIVMLLAWAIRRLWAGLVEPRALNVVLLPGTILAQVGYIVALLLGNATEREVSLLGPTEEEPDDDKKKKPDEGLPLSVALLAGLLPQLVVGAALVVIVNGWGAGIVKQVSPDLVAVEVPRDLPAVCSQLRGLVSLAEQTLAGLSALDWSSWANWLFAYLLVCLCLWLAPIHGNERGHIYAVISLGAAGALAGTVLPGLPELVHGSWPVLSVVVGVLTGLLLASLALRAVAVFREVSR